MPQLSAFLIVRNEAADIAGCLNSLKGLANEVIVVDSHSTDETVAICRQSGARVFTRVFDGYGSQKQYALEQTTGNWVLSIDADERITPGLADEIRRVLENPTHAGYEIRRTFYFLGHPLRFGGQGADWVLRLFRKDSGYFKNMKVHERIEVRGSVGRLKSPMDHFSYPNLEEYVEKCNAYTTLAAQEQYAKGRRFSWLDHLRPGWELFSRVVLKSAWLDGHAGLTYAALSGHAAWLRAIKLKQIQAGTLPATAMPTLSKETIDA
jgi:glycosyltransferase involved in cell wall biosynthesis